MIKGADRNILDNDNRKPVDFADDLRTPAMRAEIIKLLEEKENVLKDCLMIKEKQKKQGKSIKTLVIFYALMVFFMGII